MLKLKGRRDPSPAVPAAYLPVSPATATMAVLSQTPKIYVAVQKTHPVSFSLQEGKRALFSFSFFYHSKLDVQLRLSFLILPHFDRRISVVVCDWLVLFVPSRWAFPKFEAPPARLPLRQASSRHSTSPTFKRYFPRLCCIDRHCSFS